jgi:CheY-like chemotaxis protein
MDIQMPEMDGLQAAIEIRKKIPPEKRPNIIAITANAQKEDHEKYLAEGISRCIIKPFKEAELEEILKDCSPLKKSA